MSLAAMPFSAPAACVMLVAFSFIFTVGAQSIINETTLFVQKVRSIRQQLRGSVTATFRTKSKTLRVLDMYFRMY